MNYEKKHFGNCLFNPMEKDLFGTYPELKKLTNNEKMMRYIIAMYDPKSPIVSQNRDPVMRKRIAAEFAGYDMVQDRSKLEEIYNLKTEYVRTIIVRFMTEFAYPREWFMLQANEATYFEYGARMMEPITKDDNTKEKDELAAINIKSKLSEDMEKLNERIEKGYKKLFGDDSATLTAALPGRTTVESMSGKV